MSLTNVTTTLSEATDTTSAIEVAEIVITDDALGTNTLALSGTHAALFEIIGSDLYLKAGTVLDHETLPQLNVTVEVDDAEVGSTPDDSSPLSITITAVNGAPVVSIAGIPAGPVEGTEINLTADVSDPDPGDTFTYAWSVTKNGAAYDVGESITTEATFTFTPDDDATYAVTLTVTDDDGQGTASETIVVGNVAPTLAVSGDTAADEGSVFTLNLSSTDPGDDTITQWVIDWGDGQVETVTGNPPSVQHTYADGPDVYAITATATDEDGSYIASAMAEAGDLDGVFNSIGWITADPASVYDYGDATAIQSDGKIILVGYGQDNAARLLRYTTTGSLDSSFGTGGLAVLAGFRALSVALDGDGRIVIAGYVHNGANSDFALARYNSDGTLDTTFGDGGIQSTDFGSEDFGQSVAVQSDGKIVVAGYAYTGFDGTSLAVARYNADGTLDASFGTSGKLTTDFYGGNDAAYSLAVQSDGKIVVAGCTQEGDSDLFALARYNTDGSLDTSFSSDGLATADFAGTAFAYGLALQADGKIVVAGRNGADFALARFNADGALDATFSSDGLLTTDFGGLDYGRSVTIQPDGQIVVAGYAHNGSDYDFAVCRYNADGTLDTSFGTAGKRTVDLGGADYGRAMAIQSDGRILLVGTAGGDFAIVRLHGQQTAGSWEVEVLNVAPTVAINGIPTAPVEGTEINLTAAVADPGTLDTVFTYAWTVTKDGAAYASGTDSTLAFTPDDNATYVVSLTATDKDGGQGTVTETIEVANVAPTVQITGVPASPIVGTAIALDSLVDDPGTLDDMFTYAWSVTKDGAAFATGTETDFTFTPDGFAVYVVTLAVTDKDGGVGTATATIEIGGIAHWQFNETSGTTAYDASGNWLIGTLMNGAQWTTDGKLGGAIDLDGNNQYVEVADSNLLDNTSQLTVSTWVYADTLDGQARGIVSKRNGMNSQHAYSLFFHTGNRLHVYIDGAGDVFSSNTVFQTGRWYHVAVTYDGSLPEAERVKLYVDGQAR